MLQSIVNKVFGTSHERQMRKLLPTVQRINALEEGYKALSDAELKAKTAVFRQRVEKGETLDAVLPEAFGVCREASRRVLGLRHYDVQLVGGMVLHRGAIAEMKTGEGKTLTATLALYLNALAGRGAHLVTVNDYLARRDAEHMGRLYGWLGMSTGVIVPDLSESERKRSYASDITYGTNNEFGFDYLRDNMKFQLDRKVQRSLWYAIVDEVDSILIDEARTPLIISGEAEKVTDVYARVDRIVRFLQRDQHYTVDEEHRSVSLTEEGVDHVERELEVGNLYEPQNLRLVHHVQKALEAHTLYKRDEQYLIEEGKIVIIDEFTGRKMSGRRWSDGLHQAIEAKEGVEIKNESVTLATVTFQNFFRMYTKLAGMTGTAETEAEEFQKTYKLDVVAIPTNRAVIRRDQGDVVYRTENEKFAAIIEQITACNQKGQPVLVGTTNVDKSQVISNILKKKNIAHSVLNAKLHASEAEIVAQAGRKGSVTIATNMAGRGTDILLGGNPEAMALKMSADRESEDFKAALRSFTELCAQEREAVIQAGGLYILGTERHESRRIDNQLRGRAGRQGDPGESRFFLSLEDELMKRFGADRIQGLMARLGMEEGVPIEAGMVSRAIENAQKRVEGRNFDMRKHLLDYDDVMDLQRKSIYSLRDQILGSENIDEIILDVFDAALAVLLNQYANPEVRQEDWNLGAISAGMRDVFNLEVPESELPRNRGELEKRLWSMVFKAVQERAASFGPIAEDFNRRFAEDSEYKPRTGASFFHLEVARPALLQELDRKYRDHLTNMRALRESVSLHSYAQKDPKSVYKREGFALFEAMRADVNTSVTRYLMRVEAPSAESIAARNQGLPGGAPSGPARRITLDDGSPASQAAASALSQAVKAAAAAAAAEGVGSAGEAQASGSDAPRGLPRLNRNDPCWCGSGKKYKSCHYRADRGEPSDASSDESAEP